MTTTVRAFSTDSLPDASSYYSGHKQPLVTDWSEATRALSDLRTGQWEAARFTWEMSDVDGTLRAVEEARSQVGTSMALRWVSDTGRSALATARDLFTGQVLSLEQTGDYRLRVSARDGVAWMMTFLDGEDRMSPSRTLTTEDFPTCPGPHLGRVVPIFFGYHTDASDETQAHGVCVPLYAGTRTLLDGQSWHEWVVAGHACDRITAVVTGTDDERTVLASGGSGWGTTWLAAKESGWTTKVDATNYYRRYNGRDYCCLYGRGTVPDACAAGTTPLRVNLKGWTRDGIGGDYISDLFEQWLVYLVNYVCGEIIPPTGDTLYPSVREWQAGALLPMPTIGGVAMVNALSWYDVKAAADARIAGGYLGRVALDTARPIRDIMADFARSAGARYGTTAAGQYTCYGVPDTTATVDVVTSTDILRGTFAPRIPAVRDLKNGVTVRVARLPQGNAWGRSFAAEELVGSADNPTTLDLSFCESVDATTIADEAVEVATRWLAMSAARRITFTTTPCVGFQLDLGTIFSCDHDAGWPARIWQVERWSVNPTDYTVEITGVEVSALLSSRGVMRAGSLALAGAAPNVLLMQPGAGSLTVTGAAPTVVIP